MDNPENTEGVNHRWAIQRIPKGSITDGQSREYRRGQSQMGNPENTEGVNHRWTIQRNWQHRVHKTKKKTTKQCVLNTTTCKQTQIT